MFGGWGTWIAEQASVVTQIATETLDEIIAEGKDTFSTNEDGDSGASSNKNKKNGVAAVPLCLWNVVVVVEQNNDDSNNSPSASSGVASPSMFVDENMTSFPSASFPSKSKKSTSETTTTTFSYPESKFWSSNPMQWKSLIKEGLSRDVNTFVISPEALIFESSSSSFSSLVKEKNSNNNNNNGDAVDEQTNQNIKIILETILGHNNAINIEINDNEGNKVVFPESFSSLSGDSIRLMLADDPILADLRYDLVPKWVKENDFWRNFGFRVYLLSKTESIDQAIEILKIVNDEHRTLPSQYKQEVTTGNNNDDDDAAEESKDNNKNKKNSNNLTRSKYASFLNLIDSLPASQQFLVQVDSQRFHSNRSLKKKGFGVPRNTNATHDASSSLISLQELKENIHATGETESWQKHFTSRASKELENVRSVVLMLEKLIGEVEDVITSISSSSASSTLPSSGVELPSIELIHSIAESCQFHKGRVGALLGELQSAPIDRVNHHEDLDVDAGKITLALQSANAHLGEVLIKQAMVMKKLSAAVRNQQDKVEDESQKVQGQQEKIHEKTAVVDETAKKTHSNKEADADLFEDDNSSFDYVSSPVVENPSSENNKNNNDNNNQKGKKENGSEFVAQLPWDDDDV